jgi:hypothetical protein
MMGITTGTNEFSAPLGAIPGATLRFLDGMSNVRIRSDRDMPELFRAHFEGKIPRVESGVDGVVTVSYRRGPGGPGGWRGAHGEFVLNAMVPWTIEVRGGVSNLEADLTGIDLVAVEIASGVSRLDASLPSPRGDVPVRIGGGVSHLRLHRPIGAEASVSVGGGASQIALDGLRMGAVGGGIDWSSPGFTYADDRYEIQIGGGVSDIAVDAR